MANCHFINSIDRTPLLFKLNTFLYDILASDLEEDEPCFSLAPRCNDSLATAEYKWMILNYLVNVGPDAPPDTTCYFVDYDDVIFEDYDGEAFTC